VGQLDRETQGEGQPQPLIRFLLEAMGVPGAQKEPGKGCVLRAESQSQIMPTAIIARNLTAARRKLSPKRKPRAARGNLVRNYHLGEELRSRLSVFRRTSVT
jgi:hypothetical protein